MALDFERYLFRCEPESVIDDLIPRPKLFDIEESTTPISNLDSTSTEERSSQLKENFLGNEKEMSGSSSVCESPFLFSFVSEFLSDRPRPSKNGFARVTSWSSRAEEMIESRYRINQRSASRLLNGRTLLYKQTSLPTVLYRDKDLATTTTTAGDGRKRRHSVKFADEVGENLTTFQMIPSRFDDYGTRLVNKEFEQISCSVLHSKENDLSSARITENDEEKSSDEALDPQMYFQLCFDQPFANFEEFKRKLDSQMICLENVKIDLALNKQRQEKSSCQEQGHGTVLCSMKVRNIDTIKRVFARCTNNNWLTYADINATRLRCDGTEGNSNEYDTFTFALRNPFGGSYEDPSSSGPPSGTASSSYSRRTAAVEFALCCEFLDSMHWDNNNLQNYRIVWM